MVKYQYQKVNHLLLPYNYQRQRQF